MNARKFMFEPLIFHLQSPNLQHIEDCGEKITIVIIQIIILWIH
jgi:hypothetical protein